MDEINKLQGQILEHQSYLYSKDWYVSRFAETGEAIPEDVKAMRTFSRSEINRIEAEIAELEKQISEQTENVQL